MLKLVKKKQIGFVSKVKTLLDQFENEEVEAVQVYFMILIPLIP